MRTGALEAPPRVVPLPTGTTATAADKARRYAPAAPRG